MIKKDYQKPTTKVVKLQHQTHILVDSEPKTLNGTEENWEELE